MNNDAIKNAAEKFAALIEEQLKRVEMMKAQGDFVDYAAKDNIIIGICGGDGIGPIITGEAQRMLEFLLADEVAAGKISFKVIDGLTIENRIACNQPIPSDVLAEIKTCDVLLKGPTTTPHGGTMESANVAMRRELDLYANVRPVAVPDQNIDWIFFRENTEGEYVLVYNLNSIIFLCPIITHFRTVIRASIIHKYYFKIFICLIYNTFNTLI